ncbi:LysR substrate-binding domain-containing protein [Pseudovibrio sp. Tun.PSC04-5.I4]|uniref:LysR substrate-binding domain-containing protein n=1 Tax=Pseudovibrio sp. Tun.PSC04-5.I4 TaxID=1798213 RepID=UPI00088B8346|nr:LysR substrate-binding domain-containing protein [Pseudovibrio sp. Tun.PSC04-5.I4]SDQ24294.1 DNA-binding transcriptional regulator, LysR family [Pseudovibrio sp. Tun.PSC04-5.I4]
MNLSFRQLQAFREVMRTGSISEAARTLGRTQPAISSLIANLEQELGIELFLRQRGKLIRKPEAQFFLGEAEAILDRLARSTRTMREIGSLKQGRLNVAFMPASSQVLIPQLISDFVRDKPEVKVSLMMRGSHMIEEWVASQQYDVGLAETPPHNSALTTHDFLLNCICAVRSDDPLSRKDVIEAKDLSGRPLATLPEMHPNCVSTRMAFDEQKAVFNQRFELRNFLPALKLVEDGLCYCICDPMTADGYLNTAREQSSLVFRPFTPKVVLAISILLPSQRPASALANAFSEKLLTAVKEIEKRQWGDFFSGAQ